MMLSKNVYYVYIVIVFCDYYTKTERIKRFLNNYASEKEFVLILKYPAPNKINLHLFQTVKNAKKEGNLFLKINHFNYQKNIIYGYFKGVKEHRGKINEKRTCLF
jgi:hypothetical protein